MHSLVPTVLFGALASPAYGAVHHMFSGIFNGSDIYAIAFDDETNALTLANTVVSNSSNSKWIAIDERRQNVYVADDALYDSYAIMNSTNLEYSGSVSLVNCSNANFIVASTASPWTVFGVSYSAGCAANMISVDETGTLVEIIGNLEYGSTSGIHGMALSPDNKFVYSADDMGNAVWVHSVDSTTGAVEEIQYLPAPTGADPRHMTVHPKGLFAYVVFEKTNEIAVYTRDNATGKLIYTNNTYSLLPAGFTNTSSYWADEVMFSVSPTGCPKYMYASTRSLTTTIQGYVSAFSIDPIGAISSQLFINQTTNSGGAANAVTSAPFAEEYFAITDSVSNHIEVWKIIVNGTISGIGYPIAHLDTTDGPSDVVWLD